MIIVHCAVVKGDAPLSLQWLFNGRHILTDDQLQITTMGNRVSTLTIPIVKGEHAGEYACVADSPAGRVRHSAHLRVNGIKTYKTFFFCFFFVSLKSRFYFDFCTMYLVDTNTYLLVNELC